MSLEEIAGVTDEERTAAATIEQAAPSVQEPAPEQAVAEVLERVAAQSVAPTPAARPVVEAAQATLTPGQPVTPEARRGRQLLKQAVLRRMGSAAAMSPPMWT